MKQNRKTILVTGGAGFIGSEVVRQLVTQGNKVIIIDNLINGKRGNLKGLHPDQFQLIIGDIRDKKLVTKIIKNVDIIFHLACLGVRHSIHSPLENHEVNATGTLKLLLAAKDAQVKKFVYISSSEVYGTAQSVPMTEEHPIYPMTAYGASKLAGECYTRAFYKTYGYPTVVIRPFNTYGPNCHHEGDSGEVIPKFLLHSMANRPLIIFGNGTQTRDFTYVSDIARGIILAGLSDNAIGKTINLGSGKEISINNLAHEVISITEKQDLKIVYNEQRPGDVMRLRADTTKAKQILGFEPKISLHDGLTKLKNWYLNLKQSPDEMLEQEIIHNWK